MSEPIAWIIEYREKGKPDANWYIWEVRTKEKPARDWVEKKNAYSYTAYEYRVRKYLAVEEPRP